MLDLGCGSGRHAVALAAAGLIVTAVDLSPNWLDTAKSLAGPRRQTIDFHQGDIRHLDLETQFDAVLCLYDVVGSFPRDADNKAIISTIAKHLRPGGYFSVSAMNRCVSEKIAKNEADLANWPGAILNISASTHMEQTGNIWDPETMLVDKKTGLRWLMESARDADRASALCFKGSWGGHRRHCQVSALCLVLLVVSRQPQTSSISPPYRLRHGQSLPEMSLASDCQRSAASFVALCSQSAC